MNVTIDADFSALTDVLQKLEKVSDPKGRETILKAGASVIHANAVINIEAQGLIDTSKLINSIKIHKLTPDYADVGSAGVVYAAIHEFGGIIKPLTSDFLYFYSEQHGSIIKKRMVTIPARPYLRPAVDEHLDDIKNAVEYQIMRMI